MYLHVDVADKARMVIHVRQSQRANGARVSPYCTLGGDSACLPIGALIGARPVSF